MRRGRLQAKTAVDQKVHALSDCKYLPVNQSRCREAVLTEQTVTKSIWTCSGLTGEIR